MKASDYVSLALARKGISHVFGHPGGAVTHLLDSIDKEPNLEFVLLHHEQAAAFAAEGYARVSGNIGVAIATSGPGATNLITGIGSAYFDSIPCLYITGQVNSYEYKMGSPVRQVGFQETDIVSIVTPIVKHAQLLLDASQIPHDLSNAMRICTSGRPGPVLLDMPMDIQRGNVDAAESDLEAHWTPPTPAEPLSGAVEQVCRMLTSAGRPVIVAGGGISISGAGDLLRRLVDLTGIPVVCTLTATDCLASDEPAFLGLAGVYGHRYANLAVANADVLLAIGTRLTSRQTGTRRDLYVRNGKIIHVDIDPLEIGREIRADVAIVSDAGTFLKELLASLEGKSLPSLEGKGLPSLAKWRDWIDEVRRRYKTSSTYLGKGINPHDVMGAASNITSPGDVVAVDVGQNQIWAAQSFRPRAGVRVMISGGMAPMGFALPAVLGAYMARPHARPMVITGDGGLQMNIQELETIMRNRVPAIIVVMNNRSLGLIRQFQDMYFAGRHCGSVDGYSAPDFQRIAEAYGLRAITVGDPSDVEPAFEEASSERQPVLLNILIDQQSDALPKLEVSMPLEDQHPRLDPCELRKLVFRPERGDTL